MKLHIKNWINVAGVPLFKNISSAFSVQTLFHTTLSIIKLPLLLLLSCFRTSFSVLECPFPVLEHPFPVFSFFWESDFSTSRYKGVCPGILTPALGLGQSDSGTVPKSCHKTINQFNLVQARLVTSIPVQKD